MAGGITIPAGLFGSDAVKGARCAPYLGLVVHGTGDQGSGILSTMSRANCFIVLPEEGGNVEAGRLVDVQPFEGLV